MKLTEEQIKEIELALNANDETRILQLKARYNISGCNCVSHAKLREFLIKNK